MKHTRKKRNGTKRHMLLLPVFLVAVVALTLGASATELSAWHWPELKFFDEAKFFIEVNFTDKDIGVQAKVDGEAWKLLKIIAPNGRIFYAEAKGALRELGLTELPFESEEPTFEDTDDGPADTTIPEFLEPFPEGWYRFIGWTTERDLIYGKAWFSHNIPCAPEIITPQEEDGELDPADAVISWNAVENRLNNADGECGEGGITILGYQVVVEWEEEEGGTDLVFQFLVDLPATATEVTVPEDFFENIEDLGLEGDYKVEVVAIAANGNKTATEHEFDLAEDE